MSREDRKLRKHFEERAKRERLLARKASKSPGRDRPRRLLLAGLVVQTGPGFCAVLCDRERVQCRADNHQIVIGDRVLISKERRRIEELLPRRTALSRADPHNPHLERVIAANVDLVVNVVSLKNPPFRPGLIDRFLIAIGASGASPLICVNKTDLLDDPCDLESLQAYQDSGVPVLFCSALTGDGIDALAQTLAGRISVLAGHSGVGKSSLMNALDPGLDLATSAVSSTNDKGRHTTTSSTLHELPNGGMIIDTPGIREFGLWNVSAAEIRRYYNEFARYACAFSDCSHLHEPGCGVRAAAASGVIAAARYKGYCKLVQSP